jgi:hypothetical protein
MRSSLTRLLTALLFGAAALTAVVLPAAAQQGRPANLQPIPEPPPPPPGLLDDSALEPQVTITKRGEDKVEEYRVNGKLYMIRVTPPHGTPYYLVDPKGDGGFVREEVGANKSLSVPMWVIHSF